MVADAFPPDSGRNGSATRRLPAIFRHGGEGQRALGDRWNGAPRVIRDGGAFTGGFCGLPPKRNGSSRDTTRGPLNICGRSWASGRGRAIRPMSAGRTSWVSGTLGDAELASPLAGGVRLAPRKGGKRTQPIAGARVALGCHCAGCAQRHQSRRARRGARPFCERSRVAGPTNSSEYRLAIVKSHMGGPGQDAFSPGATTTTVYSDSARGRADARLARRLREALPHR